MTRWQRTRCRHRPAVPPPTAGGKGATSYTTTGQSRDRKEKAREYQELWKVVDKTRTLGQLARMKGEADHLSRIEFNLC